MRRAQAPLVLLAVLTALPLALAGPIAESGLAAHEEECHAFSWYEWSSHHANGTSTTASDYGDSEGCSERDHVTQEAGPARVEAGERAANGSGSRYQQRDTSDANGTNTAEFEGDHVVGESQETYATADAGGAARAEAVDGCYDTYSYQEAGRTDDSGPVWTWDTSRSSAWRSGCAKGASAQALGVEVARVEGFVGCQGEGSGGGTYEQHWAPEGYTYITNESGEGTYACGRSASASVAGEEAVVGEGWRCDSTSRMHVVSSPSSWEHDSEARDECVDGYYLAAPAGLFAAAGNHQVHTFTCTKQGCQSESHGEEGILVRAAGEEAFVQAPVGWVLP